jgi:hypothetical protein
MFTTGIHWRALAVIQEAFLHGDPMTIPAEDARRFLLSTTTTLTQTTPSRSSVGSSASPTSSSATAPTSYVVTTLACSW